MTSQIKITAEPQMEPNKCNFVLETTVAPTYSYFFDTKEQAQDSPLPLAIFEVPHVKSVFISDKSVMVETDIAVDWRTVARDIGTKIRSSLESTELLISQSLDQNIPSESEITLKVNEILEKEINPQVAAHGGFIKLLEVKGNNVFVEMGGGCQGCASSQATLKQGVQASFRRAIPQIGAIYDITDHASGKNPYFSG